MIDSEAAGSATCKPMKNLTPDPVSHGADLELRVCLQMSHQTGPMIRTLSFQTIALIPCIRHPIEIHIAYIHTPTFQRRSNHGRGRRTSRQNAMFMTGTSG